MLLAGYIEPVRGVQGRGEYAFDRPVQHPSPFDHTSVRDIAERWRQAGWIKQSADMICPPVPDVWKMATGFSKKFVPVNMKK